MYAKVFKQMYEGSLYGDWKALVTFQQMIVLANMDGVVDMTPQALAARTGIPLDIIMDGLETLEKADRYSRTPDRDGRRIERLDSHRPWGWQLINYKKYREMVRADEKRAADRARLAAKRQAQKDATGAEEDGPIAIDSDATRHVVESRPMSHAVAHVAHTEAEAEAEAEAATKISAEHPANMDLVGDSRTLQAFAGLPLIDGTLYPIAQAKVDDWSHAYPKVDVLHQLDVMRVWLNANPRKRKTKRGIETFIVRWLGRNQDNPRAHAQGDQAPGIGKWR